MRFPSLKSSNYTNLSLEEKVKFIKACCENRKALFQKFNSYLFGNKPSIYLSTLTANSEYLDTALKGNLNECFKKGFKKYVSHHYCTEPPPQNDIAELIGAILYGDTQSYEEYRTIMANWDNIQVKALTEGDLEVAYHIINQCFLSNSEFYHFSL